MSGAEGIGIDQDVDGDQQARREPWLGVELRHLAALSAVARSGSFRAAAEELGYVQSAISQQIAFLERLLGVRLIDRRRGVKGVAMTEAGELLLAHVDDMLARLRIARADLDELSDEGPPLLRVGVRHGLAAGVLPPVLRQLAADAPQVRVEPTEAARDDTLVALVETGELDAAFVELPLATEALEQRPLTTDEHVLLVASGARSTGSSDDIAADEVAQLGLVVHGAFADVEEHLRSHGVEPRVAMRSDATDTVEALVAAGIGAAILPALALGRERDGVERVELGHLLPSRTIGLCWRARSRESAALDALRSAASAVFSSSTVEDHALVA